MKIIGIAGTNGSGKDTLGEILAKDFGWFFVSVTDLLRQEAKLRGFSTDRKNTRAISAEWRTKFGLGVLVDKAVETYKDQTGNFTGLVLSSLRNPGEADELHRLGGILVWVDADPKIRYQRVESRLRGSEDHKTFEQFLAEEQDEMHHAGNDETALNGAAVKAKADVFLTNNTDNLENLKAAAQKALAKAI